MADEVKAAEALKLEAVIGFEGHVPGGLSYHPDGVHVIYPLGTTVVIKDTRANTQVFLQGHTGPVTAVAVSADGKFIASGQSSNMGFKAPVIVWSFAAAVSGDKSSEQLYKLELHKVRVQGLSFSPSGAYLATLGGQDDNNIVVWNMQDGKAICGSPAASHQAVTLKWFNNRNDRLVTAGQYNLRVWEFDHPGRKLRPTDCHLGQLKRHINCFAIDDTDTVAYCGTQTGDLLEVNVQNGRFTRASRNRFSLGIQAVLFVPAARDSSIVLGNGDGSVVLLDTAHLGVRKSTTVMGGVTSLSMAPTGSSFLLGTSQGNTYSVPLDSMEAELRSTAHHAPITDVCFPAGCADLFVTASQSDIRLWNVRTRAELLRIQVPNMTCNCLAVLPNGKSIVSGWDDGKIRAFYPESGKLQYVITDAHAESVTAISCTHDNTRLVSGGKDGRVRVWNIEGRTQRMEFSFKEHKGQVNHIKINSSDEEAVSASADGSCIVWNIRRGVRTNALFASTLFRRVVYHPDESQLLTCGSDRKLTYWDTADCNAIRILEGSSEEINALDIEPDGVLFVSGGNDKLVKVWHYDEGTVVASGAGHSGGISTIRISPDQSRIVSVGAEGAIFLWSLPAGAGRGRA